MLDIHVHILPAVDDGAKTHHQALQMLSTARNAGIDVLVATPHLRQINDDTSRFANAFNWLQPHAQAAGIHLLKGYEVWYQVLLEMSFSELGRYCISGTNILLLELDSNNLFPKWNRVMGRLAQEGYEPVIAHPERYAYIQEHPELIGEFKSYGCRIQVSARAFLRLPWDQERRTAEKIKRMGWMDYIASDAHRPQDYVQMLSVIRKLQGHLTTEDNYPGKLSSLTFN